MISGLNNGWNVVVFCIIVVCTDPCMLCDVDLLNSCSCQARF